MSALRDLRDLRIIAAAAVLLILSGCMVGPNYVKPKVDAPAVFKELEGWKVARPRDHVVRGAWWEVFNDPQLNALEEQVNISNQNLAAAEAQYRQALAAVQVSRSGLFPTVTGETSATRLRRSSSTQNAQSGSVSGGTQSNDFLISGTVSWEPDIWGKVRRMVEGSKAGAQASAAELESVRLSVHAQLAQDYFQLRVMDGQKHILDTTVEAYRKFLEVTRNRYAGGVSSRSDVLQAETQLKTAQAQLTDTGVQRAQMEHAIAMLTGKPPSELTIPPSPLAGLPPEIPAGVPSELLERRPDVGNAERLAAAANAQIGVAIAAYYPNITLSSTGGFEAAHVAQWLAWPARIWTLGPALAQQTLFDGGLRHAQTEQARAAYDASIASYRQTVLTAFQQVEDNLAALRILEQEYQEQNEAVRAAKQSLEVTINRYKAGTASSLEVVVTQAIALNNEINALNVLGRRMNASVLLVQGLGGGWSASELATAAEKPAEKRAKSPERM